MNIFVRESTPNDMPQVLGLIKELAVFEKSPNAVEVTVETLIKEGFGLNPLFTCFVAEVDQEIVGMALIYYRFSTWKGRSLHLEDLIVKEKMRGSGIGKALYTKVIEYAYEKKVKRIEWAVLNWNKDAIQFYKKSGAIVMKDWYITHMEEAGIKNYIAKL
jgi:GNAT superfamily N-acetyltransferase